MEKEPLAQTSDIDILLPLESNKSGPALWTEQTVQGILDTPAEVNEHFAILQKRLRSHFERARERDPITAKYHETQRIRQATHGYIGALALARALPHMIAWHKKRGSLIPLTSSYYYSPEMRKDDTTILHSTEYYRSMKAAYWLNWHTVGMVYEFWKSDDKTEWQLWDWLDFAHHDYIDTWRTWSQRHPDQWPRNNSNRGASGGDSLLSSLSANLGLSLSSIAARSAWYTVHKNPQPTYEELADCIRTKDIIELSNLSTVHRHLDKQASNVQAKPVLTQPAGIWEGLCKWQASERTTDPLQPIVKKYHMVAREDGCPHDSLLQGGWKNAGSCPGSLLFRYPDAADRDNASEFFAMLSFDERLGEHFSLSIASMAIAHSVAKDTIYPLWPEIVAGQKYGHDTLSNPA